MKIILPTIRKDWQEDINYIINQSLLSVDPYKCVSEKIEIIGEDLFIFEKKIDLRRIGDIYVIGVGKAVSQMACALIDKIGKRISYGFLISKYPLEKKERKIEEKIQYSIGGHPIPNRQSIDNTKKLISFLSKVKENDLVINLISGGGSALMTLPCEGIYLDDIRHLTNILLKCGATIQEINIIRKHIENTKGGGLLRITYPTHMETLILSDVIDNQISMIASGPTSNDDTTYSDAWRIIRKYHIEHEIPNSIKDHIKKGMNGDIQETVKSGDEILKKNNNTIIGSLTTAVAAAETAAKKIGYNTRILSTRLIGEAREVGNVFGTILSNMVRRDCILRKPACVIAGGETTVTVLGNGEGGRNQELALGAVEQIGGLHNCCLISIATDGEDGPTDAAGAFITGQTKLIAKEKGLDIEKLMSDNDSYNFFKKTNNLLKFGPTGTNVNDLLFLFAF